MILSLEIFWEMDLACLVKNPSAATNVVADIQVLVINTVNDGIDDFVENCSEKRNLVQCVPVVYTFSSRRNPPNAQEKRRRPADKKNDYD